MRGATDLETWQGGQAGPWSLSGGASQEDRQEARQEKASAARTAGQGQSLLQGVQQAAQSEQSVRGV